MSFRRIEDAPSNKTALVRVDFNVPMADGAVSDDTRLRAALPTINALTAKGCKVALLAHFDRPKGKRVPEMSLQPVAAPLSALLGAPVAFADDCVGADAKAAIDALPAGGVILLENTRFHAGEEMNDLELAKQMAALGDVYVNDAFGSAHRAHSSTEGIARFLPAVSGFLMEQELEYLGRAVANPLHPYIAILGGAKISDKILVVETLLSKCDKLIIGGGMANTFLAAQGLDMQDSLVEEVSFETARAILVKSKDKLILPVDAVIADKFDAEANTQIVDVENIPAGWRMLDVGPQTLELYKTSLDGVRLVVWNGPVGVFEMPKFAEGTFALARMLAESGAITVIGGGDSASAVKKAGVAKQMTHVSTGGGASLEFLEGKELPGVAALMDK